MSAGLRYPEPQRTVVHAAWARGQLDDAGYARWLRDNGGTEEAIKALLARDRRSER